LGTAVAKQARHQPLRILPGLLAYIPGTWRTLPPRQREALIPLAIVPSRWPQAGPVNEALVPFTSIEPAVELPSTGQS
jgi:hypothetical protein